jgi:chromosome segregation ATPase
MALINTNTSEDSAVDALEAFLDSDKEGTELAVQVHDLLDRGRCLLEAIKRLDRKLTETEKTLGDVRSELAAAERAKDQIERNLDDVRRQLDNAETEIAELRADR